MGTTSMTMVVAFLTFVASHVLLARPAVRAALVARIGERGYLLGYSLLSIALLGWVIAELLQAPRWILWSPPPGSTPFALLCSALAFLLLAVGVTRPQPFSVGVRAVGAVADSPGPLLGLRHPLLAGFGLWGFAHLPANGEWPTVLLFGGTLAFAVLGARQVERRRVRQYGEPLFEAWRSRRRWPDRVDWLALVAGLLVWGLVLSVHQTLFGVDPLVSF